MTVSVCLTIFFIALTIPNWIVPTLIGIAGSGVFYWLGRRYRPRSRLAFQKSDFMVVGHTNSTKSLGGIKILFKDVDVPRVVVTRLAVWNVGNTVVDASQLATSAPLALAVEAGALILDAQIVKASNAANMCRLRIAEDLTRAFVEFDYLNEQDGALFQVTHTGAQNTAKLTGSIKGIAKGVEDWGDLTLWEEQRSRSLKPLAYIIGSGVVLLLISWLKDRMAPKYPILNTISNWVGAVFVLLILLLMLTAVIAFLYQTIQTRSRTIPKSLSRS
jgi:hypothetical protein